MNVDLIHHERPRSRRCSARPLLVSEAEGVRHLCLGPAILPSIFTLQRVVRCLLTPTSPDTVHLPHAPPNMSTKPRIPSWQRTSPDTTTASPAESESQPIPGEPSERGSIPVAEAPTPTEDDIEEPENTGLLEQASRFLDDATIRDAPREKKVAFLESKGVDSHNIKALLGLETQVNDIADLEEAGERAWSTVRSSDSCRCR